MRKKNLKVDIKEFEIYLSIKLSVTDFDRESESTILHRKGNKFNQPMINYSDNHKWIVT